MIHSLFTTHRASTWRMVHCALYAILSLPLSAQVLYEISGNMAASKSYLLATNRLVDMQFLDTIPNALKCFADSKRVITEFAFYDYEAMQALRQGAVLPDSILFKDCYTESEYEYIDQELMIRLGSGLKHLCRMKPSYLTQMVRDELLKQWLDYDSERTMDYLLLSIAAEKNMPVIGLDGLGETMYMQFDREPFAWTCKELLNILHYPEREIQLERELKSMYQMGRLTDMAFLIISPDNQSTLSYSDYQVFIRRNMGWVKRLGPYLQEGKSFIILDAMYLGGDDGLIAYLKKTGYRIRAVNR